VDITSFISREAARVKMKMTTVKKNQATFTFAGNGSRRSMRNSRISLP